MSDLVQTYGLTILYAQSGCGKTSLLEAGLTPYMSKARFRVLTARVGGDSSSRQADEHVFLANLLATLSEEQRTVASDTDIERWSQGTVDGALFEVLSALGLVYAADDAPHSVRKKEEPGTDLEQPVLLILDQFEELFTTHLTQWKARRSFLSQLGAAVARSNDFHVLLAIREDYLAELDPYVAALPNGLRIRYRLERLRRRQVEETIRGPLEPLGVELDAELADGVVQDLMSARMAGEGGKATTFEGEFAEPVHVQVACEQLWGSLVSAHSTEERHGRLKPSPQAEGPTSRAPWRSVDVGFQCGGRHYTCGAAVVEGIDDALAAMFRRAVRLAAREGHVSEALLRRFVERALITSSATRGIAAGEAFDRAGVKAAAVNALVAQRILCSEPRRGTTWYELTHDRFVTPIRRDNRAWNRERRQPWRGLAALGMAVLMAAVPFLWHQQHLAEQARLRADEGRARAEQARRKAESSIRPLVYVGSGTVLDWLKLKKINLDKFLVTLNVGSNTGLEVFVAANKYGQSKEGSAVLGGFAGVASNEELEETFGNEKLQPGGRIYAVHLDDAQIFTWIFGPCGALPKGAYDLSLDDLGRYLSASTAGRLFFSSKVSGTRKRVDEYLSQAREKDTWDKARKAFDNGGTWGNSLRALAGTGAGDRDKACSDARASCAAVGSFVEEGVSLDGKPSEEEEILQRHEGDRCTKRYVLCQDEGGGKCPRLTNPLYLVGRAEPGVSSLGPTECEFIGSLADSIHAGGQDAVRDFARAQCQFNDSPGDSLITWINGPNVRSATVRPK